MKTCKQCHRLLDDSAFRPTKSRGTGLRQTKTGTKTICRTCEALDARAYRFAAALEAGESVNEDALNRLRKHYQMLMDIGYPLVTAAAKRLMGVSDEETTKPDEDSLMTDADLYEHIAAVRNRSYSSFDEADEVHSRLAQRLRDTGLYEDVNNLMDAWFEEG